MYEKEVLTKSLSVIGVQAFHTTSNGHQKCSIALKIEHTIWICQLGVKTVPAYGGRVIYRVKCRLVKIITIVNAWIFIAHSSPYATYAGVYAGVSSHI